jgi:hypothetical protein
VISAQNPTWKTVGRMLVPVTRGSAVVHDSIIYIFGGYSDSLHNWVNFIQAYNPKTNTWSRENHMVVRRDGLLAVPAGDSVLIFGGVRGSGSIRNSLEVWDFESNSYVYRYHRSFDRYEAAGTIFRNKLYMIGGVSREHGPADTAAHYLSEFDLINGNFTYAYDSIFTMNWTPTQQMGVLADSTFFLFGGYYNRILNTVARFDMPKRTFKTLSYTMSKARSAGAALYLGEKKIMIIGGYSESSNALATTEYYTISGGTFTYQQGPALNQGRKEFMYVKYGNSVYVFGGTDYNNFVISTFERIDFPTDVDDGDNTLPNNFELLGNYPNPFNPSTTIAFSLPEQSQVSVDVYSSMGEHIASLASGLLPPGKHEVQWNGAGETGNAAPSGIYFYTIRAKDITKIGKMLLLK